MRNLRPAGTRTRAIPYGYGFDLVSCPNYFFESIAWLSVCFLSTSWSGKLHLNDGLVGVRRGRHYLIHNDWQTDTYTLLFIRFFDTCSHTIQLSSFLSLLLDRYVIDRQNVACLLLSLIQPFVFIRCTSGLSRSTKHTRGSSRNTPKTGVPCSLSLLKSVISLQIKVTHYMHGHILTKYMNMRLYGLNMVLSK